MLTRLFFALLALALTIPAGAQTIPAGRVALPDGTLLPTALTGKCSTAGCTLTGPLTLAGDPAAPLQPATKGYVDLVIQGLSTKTSVRVATTTNITLSGLQTVDGVALAAGDRVLVKAQTDASKNGIRIAATGAWPPASDMDVWSEVVGSFVFVTSGTSNNRTGWTTTAVESGTLGTTAMPWTQFSGAGTYTAGSGLALSGGTFSLAPSADATLRGNVAGTSAIASDLTPAQVRTLLALDQVSNTADAAKPVSTAQAAAIAAREPAIVAGATSQYWRGDKTWVTLTKSVVGLGSVDNTTDAAKPISTATQAALDLRVLKAGDTMTGGLVAPSLSTLAQIITSAGGLTIAADAITVTGSFHTLSNEGGAPTDDLITINGGTPGQLLILAQAGGAQQVTVRRTGNIILTGGDFVIGTSGTLLLRYSGTSWVEISRTGQPRFLASYSADASMAFTRQTGGSVIAVTGGLWTASRNLTLNSTLWLPGDQVRVVNLTTTLFSAVVKNLTNGGTTLATLAPGRWADFIYQDATLGWLLIGSGAVSAMP